MGKTNDEIDNIDATTKYLSQAQALVTTMRAEDGVKHHYAHTILNDLWILSDILDSLETAAKGVIRELGYNVPD